MKISGHNLKMLIREMLLENEIYDYDNKFNVAPKRMSSTETPLNPHVVSAKDAFKRNYKPPVAKLFDLNKVADETASRFNEDYKAERLKINAPMVRAGKRRLVTAYGQNRDVFVYGPFKNYVVKTINGMPQPDKHFKDNYGSSTRATMVFDLMKKYAKTYIDSKKEKKKTVDHKTAQKELWPYFKKYTKDPMYKETEKYWEDLAAASEKKGKGTHFKGKAFDMVGIRGSKKGWNKSTKQSHKDLLYKVAKEVAKEYSAEFLMPGTGTLEEPDHIHMAYKVN